MKRVLIALFAFTLIIPFAGCSNRGADASAPVPSSEEIAFTQPVSEEPASEAETPEAGEPVYEQEPLNGTWVATGAIISDKPYSLDELAAAGGEHVTSYQLEFRPDATFTLSYSQDDELHAGDGTWHPKGENEDKEPLYKAIVGDENFDITYNEAEDTLSMVIEGGSLLFERTKA